MSTTLDNIKIALRIDDLSNWNNSNIILNNGELALIRMPSEEIKIKCGNGQSYVSALSYINEKELFSNIINANNLNIGLINTNYIKDNSFAITHGMKLSANGAFSEVHGVHAKSLSSHSYAYIWNGNIGQYYQSHGEGTFSLNPKNGLSGLYIGEKTLADILSENIYINGQQTTSLSICNISQNDYHELVATDSVLSNVLYIVSSDNLNAYGEQIKNVANGIDLSDAVNLNQLCSAISSIDIPEIPTKVSVFENDVNYTKLSVDQIPITNFNIKHISQDEYHNEVINGVDPNALYIVSSDTLNMYGESIQNLANPINETDATNKKYVDSISSVLSNDYQQKIDQNNIIYDNKINVISNIIDNKITIDSISTQSVDIKHISQNDYYELVANEQVLSNVLYIVSSDTLNMYGEQIKNLSTGTDPLDATNVEQVTLSIDNVVANINSTKNEIVDQLNKKIYIDSISAESISVQHITQDDYHELVATDSVLSNTLYIVSSDNLNAYGEKITNVLSGIDSTDAATFGQIQQLSSDLLSEINKIEIPSNISELSNDVGFITANIDDTQVSSINIKHITQDDYYELVANEQVLSNTLYIVSSDNLNVYNERIENVAEPLSANDATNKAYVDKSTIQDICLIKPVSDNKLFIKLYFSENADLTDTFELDSKLQPEFFKGLVSSSNLMSWLQQPEDGFNKSFNSLPITIELVRYLASINKSHIYKFYVKYEWYFEDENGNKHISDQYSIIIPSYTEVGANSSETINKFDFENIKQQVNPEDYNTILDENNYYVAYSTKYNTITDLVEDNSYIALADYNTHKCYKIDFRTNTDQNVKLNFYIDLGSGSFEYSDKLNSEQYTFEKDKHYLIEIIDERIYVQNADKVYSEVSDSVSKYPLILAEMIETDGQLTYKIIDHSITTIEITDENKPVTLTLPDKDKNKYARDFILRVEIKSSVAPMFTFVGLDDSWFVESDNEEWMIMEPGVNIISFTETKA